MNELGGRKFIFALLCLFIGFMLVCLNQIDAKSYLDYVLTVGATFVAGNAIEHVTDAIADNQK